MAEQEEEEEEVKIKTNVINFKIVVQMLNCHHIIGYSSKKKKKTLNAFIQNGKKIMLRALINILEIILKYIILVKNWILENSKLN